MKRRVNFGDRFIRDVKSLQKRFPLIELDVKACRREIELGETVGSKLSGIGFEVYKTRLPNRSARRGKRGGFRLLYVLHGEDMATFLHIYSKSDKNDASPSEIQSFLRDLGLI